MEVVLFGGYSILNSIQVEERERERERRGAQQQRSISDYYMSLLRCTGKFEEDLLLAE